MTGLLVMTGLMAGNALFLPTVDEERIDWRDGLISVT